MLTVQDYPTTNSGFLTCFCIGEGIAIKIDSGAYLHPKDSLLAVENPVDVCGCVDMSLNYTLMLGFYPCSRLYRLSPCT